MKKLDRGFLLESTGRIFYANGYIGAMESFEGSVDIAQGYDGMIEADLNEDEFEWDDLDDSTGRNTKANLTTQEKIELADYMIDLWQQLKRNLTP